MADRPQSLPPAVSRGQGGQAGRRQLHRGAGGAGGLSGLTPHSGEGHGGAGACPADPYPKTTAAQFSHALGKVNDKYIMEAITYERKKKSVWLKWGAMAACLCFVILAAVCAHLSKGKADPSTPMGQGYFNATVIEVFDSSILVRCTDSFLGEIPVGSEVQVSTNTRSDEKVPEVEIGDNIRVLYIGEGTERNPYVLGDVISIFMVDENGEAIID